MKSACDLITVELRLLELQLSGWPITFWEEKLLDLSCKITLLILDYAPTHTKKDILEREDRQVKTIFLPSNVTSFLQPANRSFCNQTRIQETADKKAIG